MNILRKHMKLAGLTAAALLLIGTGLAGSASASKGPDVVAPPAASTVQGSAAAQGSGINIILGSWTLTTDFGCDGSITGSFTQTFNADGTWTSAPFVHSGRWYQVGGVIVWTFNDVANLVYSGNVSGSWISGVQGYELAGGINGCFGGRVTGVAVAGSSANGKDPVLG